MLSSWNAAMAAAPCTVVVRPAPSLSRWDWTTPRSPMVAASTWYPRQESNLRTRFRKSLATVQGRSPAFIHACRGTLTFYERSPASATVHPLGHHFGHHWASGRLIGRAAPSLLRSSSCPYVLAFRLSGLRFVPRFGLCPGDLALGRGPFAECLQERRPVLGIVGCGREGSALYAKRGVPRSRPTSLQLTEGDPSPAPA